MSIYRRKMPNGKLSKRYYYDFRHNGKRFFKSTGLVTEREAKNFEKEFVDNLKKAKSAKKVVEDFRDALNGGKKLVLNESVFELFLSKYLQRKNASGKKPKRIGLQRKANKKAQWCDFVAFVLDNYSEVKYLSEVSNHIAEEYISFLRTSGKYNKQVQFRHKGHRRNIKYQIKSESLSPATCNSYHNTLSQVFYVLAWEASLETNPFKEIPKLSNDYESREAFTPEELRLIGKNADDFLYPLFAIGINSGLRKCDICLLKVSEIDLAGGWITHKTSKTKKVVKIPILNQISGYLSELVEKTTIANQEFLLPAHAKMYKSNRTGISYRVKRFLESIGIKTTKKVEGRSREVSIKDIHSCRHTFCYLAAVNGVPYPIVKNLVGHVSERVTQLYTDHVTDEMKKLKMQYMPDYLGRPQDSSKITDGVTVESRDQKLLRIIESITPTNMKSKKLEAIELLGCQYE